MTATTYPATSAPPVRATSTTKALKAEWTKLRTLPSTFRTAAMATCIAIGMSAAVVASQASQCNSLTAQQRRTFDAASASMSGVMVAALLLGQPIRRTRRRAGRQRRRRARPGRSHGRRRDVAACCWDSGAGHLAADHLAGRRHRDRRRGDQPDAGRPDAGHRARRCRPAQGRPRPGCLAAVLAAPRPCRSRSS